MPPALPVDGLPASGGELEDLHDRAVGEGVNDRPGRRLDDDGFGAGAEVSIDLEGEEIGAVSLVRQGDGAVPFGFGAAAAYDTLCRGPGDPAAEAGRLTGRGSGTTGRSDGERFA